MADWAASGGVAGVEPHFTRDVQVFDSLGRARNVTMAFLKTPTANEWAVEMHADPGLLDSPPHPATGLVASGTIAFDGQGRLAATNITPVVSGVPGDPVEVQWLAASGADASTISV